MRMRVLISVVVAMSWTGVVPVFAADTPGKSSDAAKLVDAAAKSADAAAKSADAAAKSADDADAAAKRAAAVPNDRTNYLGDKIVFKGNTIAYLPGSETKVCVPAGTYFRGIGVGTDKKGRPLFVVDCNWHEQLCGWCRTKRFEALSPRACGVYGTPEGFVDAGTLFSPGAPGESNADEAVGESKADEAVGESKADEAVGESKKTKTKEHKENKENYGGTIAIPQSTLNETPPNRYGFTFGGLVVPFKFQLSGKKEFKGSASAAPYMGYRFGFEASGIELAFPIVFAGVSNVSATKTTTTTTPATDTTPASSVDKTSTSNLAAFSYGTGVIGILKQSFQFGAVIGFDHVGSGEGYDYNDKPWLAVEIGYQFSR